MAPRGGNQTLADYVGARYSFLLGRSHTHLSQDLPILVAEINIKQSELLARTNEIYDDSSVSEPLDKAIILAVTRQSASRVSTTYETALFPALSDPNKRDCDKSGDFGVPPAVVTAPAAPVDLDCDDHLNHFDCTSVTPTPAQPSGIPVIGGMIEVHDRTGPR